MPVGDLKGSGFAWVSRYCIRYKVKGIKLGFKVKE